MHLSALLRDLPIRVFSVGKMRAPVLALTSDDASAAPETLFLASEDTTPEQVQNAYDQGCKMFLLETPIPLEDAFVVLAKAPIAQVAYQVAARFYGFDPAALSVVAVSGFRGKTTTSLLIRTALLKCGIRADYTGPLERIFDGRKDRVHIYPPSIPAIVADLSRMQKSGARIAVVDLAQGSEVLLASGLPIEVLVLTAGSPAPALACAPKVTVLECRSHRGSERTVSSESGALEARHVRSDVCKGALFTTCSVHAAWIHACFSIKTAGRHNVRNALLAIQVLHHFGIGNEMIVSAMASAVIPGKIESLVPNDRCALILDDAYDESRLVPTLAALREAVGPGRIAAVIGSVGSRAQERRATIAKAIAQFCDIAVLTEDNADFEPVEQINAEIAASFPPGFPYLSVPNREDAIRCALRQGCDAVAFFGKGDEPFQRVRRLEHPYSERLAILEAWEEIEKERGLN